MTSKTKNIINKLKQIKRTEKSVNPKINQQKIAQVKYKKKKEIKY